MKLEPFIRNCCRRETVKRALMMAIVVGPILTLINHHEEIMNLKFSGNFLIKSFLTFLVPYFVSTYSSAQAYLENERRKSEPNPDKG